MNYGINAPYFTKSNSLNSSYGTDLSGFKKAIITSLGYPENYAKQGTTKWGASMVRTDSLGILYSPSGSAGSNIKNLIWGSSMSGNVEDVYHRFANGITNDSAVEGAPAIVNFGEHRMNSQNITYRKARKNTVVGVLNWGYSSQAEELVGGTLFSTNDTYSSTNYADGNGRSYGGGNIGYLIREACGDTASGYGGGQADGACF